MTDPRQDGPDCGTVLRLVHRDLDGEPLTSDERVALGRHLLVCPACRELRDDLVAMQGALRGLPQLPLPADARRAVLAATTGGPGRGRRGRADWRAVAAAAVLALAVVGLSRLASPPAKPLAQPVAWVGTADYPPAELARAEREARMVLALTADALRRTQRVTVHRVLAGEVSPALERVPIDWPTAAGRGKGRHAS